VDKKGKNIDDLIREGFDSLSDDGLDLDSWGAVEQRLDGAGEIDQIVASAFDIEEEEVPKSVWGGVKEELDIDTVWVRINQYLTKRRKIVIAWWNAASIAFIIIFAGLLSTDLINNNEKENIVTHQAVELEKNGIPSENKNEFNNELVDVSASQAVEIESRTSSNTDEREVDSARPITLKNNQGNALDKNTSKRSSSIVKDEKNTVLIDSIFTLKPKLVRLREAQIVKELLLVDSSLSNTTNNETSLPQSSKTSNESKRWVVGLSDAVLNSTIHDAFFSQASNENSLVSSNMVFSFNPGVFVRYLFKNKWNIETEFHFNYKVKRSLQVYDQLEFVTRSTELTYQRLDLRIGRSFIIDERSNNFQINTSLGIFTSYLNNQEDYQGKTLVGKEKEYSNWDFGFGGQLEIQHNIKRFTLAYGPQVTYGIKDISIKTNQTPSSINRVRSFSTGIFLRLGYRF
jgi:hypothetical protein